MTGAERLARVGAGISVFVFFIASLVSAGQAAFPGFNGFIAFAGPDGLFAMRPEGGPKVAITDGADFNPSWSPDGLKLLFDRDLNGQTDIFVTSFPSGVPINLTDDPANDSDPAWSPDGSQLVFTSSRDGESRLFTMDADGSNVAQITTAEAGPGSGDAYPVWSPDGSRIAFTRGLPEFRALGYSAIMTVSPDGTNLKTISSDVGSGPTASGRVHHLDWSRDGSTLVFGRGGSACSGRIAIMSADGSNGWFLVAPLDPDFPIPDGCVASEPAWSPDGHKIVFNLAFVASGPSNDATGTYTINIDGTDLKRLPTSGFVPAWQPLGFLLPTNPPVEPTTTTVGTTPTTVPPTTIPINEHLCADLALTRAAMDSALIGNPFLEGVRRGILDELDRQLSATGC